MAAPCVAVQVSDTTLLIEKQMQEKYFPFFSKWIVVNVPVDAF